MNFRLVQIFEGMQSRKRFPTARGYVHRALPGVWMALAGVMATGEVGSDLIGGRFSVSGEPTIASPKLSGGRYGVEGDIETVLSVAIEGGPLLAITFVNGWIQLTWPKAASGFVLQATQNPVDGPWMDLATEPAGPQHAATLIPGSEATYFRLIRR